MKAKARIIIVDDDTDSGELVALALGEEGYAARFVDQGEAALRVVQSEPVDLIVTDLQMPGMNGLQLCERVVESHPDTPVLVMTAYGSLHTAVGAIRAGAYDFISKPVDIQTLLLTVERAVRHRQLREEVTRLRQVVERSSKPSLMVAGSESMAGVIGLLERIGDSDATVLITGESGTGKELVARELHQRSGRVGPLLAINCAALPPTLLESELFGHVRGAFTDAKNSREGLFIQAHRGTLFLDEIGEMPAEMQATLLRVLQERKVRPIGGHQERSFDTRIITATNRDIDSVVEAGEFREDLFYRINVVRVHVPPLRSRGNDVLVLAQHFVDRFAKTASKAVRGISPATAQKLLAYDWPGNVRELENCVERAVTLTRLEELCPEDLPDKIRDHTSTRYVIGGNEPEDLVSLSELEVRYIRRVLEATGGNKTQAAKILGVDRRTLYRKLDRP